jgi:phage shock protein E
MLGFLKNIFGPSADFADLLENKNAVIIDVRSPQEFQSGHIKGALNIPLQTISANTNKIKNMNRPVITCCKSGARSGMAKSQLQSQGVEVYNGGPWNSLLKFTK